MTAKKVRPPFSLRQTIRDIEADLQRRAATADVADPGSLGRVREGLLASAIKLPPALAVAHSAEIIGEEFRSGQCDLTIYETSAPPLVEYDQHTILRGDSVRAVIEVKSDLSTAELERGHRQVTDAIRASASQYRGTAAGFIVAFRTESSMGTLKAEFDRLQSAVDWRERLVSVWVLGRGGIVYATSDEKPWPSGGVTENCRILATDDTLFVFLWMLYLRVYTGLIPPFDLTRYVPEPVEPPLWQWVSE